MGGVLIGITPAMTLPAGAAGRQVVQVAAFANHSCAVLSDGSVQCWGLGAFGELGNGTTVDPFATLSTTDSGTPVTVLGISNAVQVSVALTTSCAVLADGTASCWGGNYYGQLGNGTVEWGRSVPVPVFGLHNVARIAVGGTYACAALLDTSVTCWGASNPTTQNSSIPVTIPNLTGVRDLAAAGGSVCALLYDRSVKCFAYAGLLSVPAVVPGVSTATAISVSGAAECAVLDDGAVRCWDNSFSSTGTAAVPDLNSVSMFSGSPKEGCALITDGTVQCWSTSSGQATPTTVSGLANVVQISGADGGGGSNTQGDTRCAVLASGAAKCWGTNQYGAVGDGRGMSTVPVAVNGLDDASEMFAAGDSVTSGFLNNGTDSHTCALSHSGSVWCWGSNRLVALGNGKNDGVEVTEPALIAGLANVTAMASTNTHSCAVLADTTVRCWGRNFAGNIGNGVDLAVNTSDDVLEPVSVVGLSNASAVIVGNNSSCALLLDTTVTCWGTIGTGATRSSIPVPIPNFSGAVEITSGYNYKCALMTDGTVDCWGLVGSLVPGRADSAIPVPINGLTGVTHIAGGTSHLCAVMSDGTAKCLGTNYYGQLGDGTLVSSGSPVTVHGLTGVVSISAGWEHSCAALADGSVRCWGRNQQGQLGNGTLVPSPFPQTVLNLDSATNVTTTFSHSCASLADGTAKCWGGNVDGQLGNGHGSVTVKRPTGVLGLDGSPTVPEIPASFSVTPEGDGSASVDVTAAGDGGAPISGFDILCVSSNGGQPVFGFGPASPVTVNGFSTGKSYQCLAAVVNSAGTSAATSFSRAFSVVPAAGGICGGLGLSTSSGSEISNVTNTQVTDALPNNAVVLTGALSYTVTGLKVGGTADVTLELPPGCTPSAVFKKQAGVYVDLTSAAAITGDSITLHLTDGATGDADGIANGIIVDPVVPAGGETPAPTITTQPAGQSVTERQAYTFRAAASGIPNPTVQWQVSTDGGATFTDLPGATGTTLTRFAALADSGQSFRAAFTNAGGTVITQPATLNVHLCGSACISVGDKSVLEGNSGSRTITFPVTLSQPSATAVSVHYAVTALTATGGTKAGTGDDFKLMSGTVTFTPSLVSKKTPIVKTIAVPVYGDVSMESDQTFQVTLSNVTGGYGLGRDIAQGTILNDDVGVSGNTTTAGVGDASLIRSSTGTTTLTVPVTLSAKSGPISFAYKVIPGTAKYSKTATGGGDYGKLNGTISFPAGAISKTIGIPIWANSHLDPDKSFSIALSPITGTGVTIIRSIGSETIGSR